MNLWNSLLCPLKPSLKHMSGVANKKYNSNESNMPPINRLQQQYLLPQYQLLKLIREGAELQSL